MRTMLSEDTGGFDRTVVHGLSVDPIFYQFIETELMPLIGMGSDEFWSGLATLVSDLTPVNRELLVKRDALQQQIDDWHREHPGRDFNHSDYVEFLTRIGYLREPGEPFRIETQNVDREIATVAGPQLVVPVSNARFAINAANARWGSLYDALYGTDVIPADQGREPGGAYNPVRGKAVIEYATTFLDKTLPLDHASHAEVDYYAVDRVAGQYRFVVNLVGGQQVDLVDAGRFAGFRSDGDRAAYLFENHGLHIEILTDPHHPVGKSAAGNVADVILESALTTIQDCEDSVAAVDAEDKVGVYRNWLGLMTGDLSADFEKAGRSMTRTLADDRHYTAIDGSDLVLSGRSLMLVRNVGHLMTNDAVLDASGNEIFEGILDAVITTACALANHGQVDRLPNSRFGSIYIVKPKMHGPEEVAFSCQVFSAIEQAYGLAPNTVKIGIMDEERRTTVNLKECIRQARERVIFINTGFLDRTGDEIHTSMELGPVLPKAEIKNAKWISAYEDWNVDVGLACGLAGRAQIGKGMWPIPDQMANMIQAKVGHPTAGANCAWVPSPTAATLHAMHYHDIDVSARQSELRSRDRASLDDILTPPLLEDPSRLDAEQIQRELDNNAQGILGYVVRWIDQGVGCSKVPDINDVGLMEDRATLRISSQHMANWLHHGLCDESQVRATFERMAAVVDQQNAADPDYRPMAPGFDGVAFQAALDLVLAGCAQPNGYTEPVLHARRFELKTVLQSVA